MILLYIAIFAVQNYSLRVKIMNKLKIGIVVADGDEYAPLENEIVKGDYEEYNFLARKGHKFTVAGVKAEAEVVAINCGIGKVNAAVATMHLVDSGCNVILNYGLSGGISGIKRGELCLGTSFLQMAQQSITAVWLAVPSTVSCWIWKEPADILERTIPYLFARRWNPA